MDKVSRFFRAEEGQDMLEYTLILMLIALASILVLQQAGYSMHTIWSGGSNTLQTAANRQLN